VLRSGVSYCFECKRPLVLLRGFAGELGDSHRVGGWGSITFFDQLRAQSKNRGRRSVLMSVTSACNPVRPNHGVDGLCTIQAKASDEAGKRDKTKKIHKKWADIDRYIAGTA
jgi:hypothetical protein